MTLTTEQEVICNERLKEHRHADYTVNLQLPDLNLRGFHVAKEVLRPEKTSALYLARFLAGRADLLKDRAVLDMGCGSGIQGVVAALSGAKSVLFSDISEQAFKNTEINVARFRIKSRSRVIKGDLFENVYRKFDVIIFNHPFFPSTPLADEPVTKAWFDEGQLLQRFLEEAPLHLHEGGMIIMPFFEFAGDTNNPYLQGMKQGYTVEQAHTDYIDDANLQKGKFFVFILTKR